MQLNSQKRNIAAAITEHVVSVLVMFITYRYAIGVLGLKTVGLWSLIVAIFSLSSIGNSGFASSAVKFVSKYLAKNDYASIVKVISTTFLTVLVITIFLIATIFFSIQIFHESLFSDDEYGKVNEVIFLGGISFSTAIFGRVFLSALDGLQLINYRSYIGIVSKIFYGVLCVLLLRSYGLKGLIFAEFMQYLIVLIGSIIILLLNLNPSLKQLLPDKIIFKEIFAYGTSFQITSIFQMLMDPLTKFYLKTFGGLDSVALYDIAYKFFFQARLLIVTVVTTFVPYVSILKEKSEFDIKPLFMKVFKSTTTLSISLILIIFSALPILFSFMKIYYTINLLQYSICIAATLFVNLLGVTPFIFNLGTGHLKSNLIFTIVMSALNVLLGYFLGLAFGAVGVLVAVLCAQVIGLLILIISFSTHFLIPLKIFFDKTTNLLIILFTVYLGIFFIIHSNLSLFKTNEFLLNLTILLPLIIFIIWSNHTLKTIAYKWINLGITGFRSYFKVPPF